MQAHPALAAPADLVDLLRLRAGEPDSLGLRFLAGRNGDDARLSFAQLDRRARAVAAALAERGLGGARALLCYPPGLEFMVGLYGALYAGLVAVPAYPPRAHKPDARLAGIAASCRPRVVLTTAELFADRERLAAQMPQLARLPWLASDAVADDCAGQWREFRPAGDDLAVLQYTSGSTGDPKGVMLTHRCILHNIAGISRAMGLGRGSVGVTWLPAFHDMGLIGNLLGVIWYPGTLHVLSPLAMLQDPFRWLEAVSRTKAYISGGPCFAYEQCVKRVTAEQREKLDLSAWKVAYVGAEPISSRILDEFARTFADCGFRRESFYPCYGLAESSLMVTGGEAGRGPTVRTFLGAALERDRAEPAEKGRALVGCGAPIDGMAVRIVDPATGRPSANGGIGEVWVNGPSVAAGYFERPEATEATFGATLEGKRWLRTGDLGFWHDGELYIAGRLKDVLILRGRNYYPQDIEEAVQTGSAVLKSGGGAAFTVGDDDGARLVLVYEVQRNYKPGQPEVFESARAVIAEEFGVELSELVLIRTGSLPRTSSGKVARRETMQRHRAGELDVVEHFVAPAEEAPLSPDPSPPLRGRGEHHPFLAVQAWLVDRLARQLQVDPSRIDPDKPFAGYGLDSLAMVRIAGELERWLGRPLSPTLLYSAPTIARLARVLGAEAPPAPAAAVAPALTDGIAIVGIACRFPGADGPEAFWQLLREGRRAIRDLPVGRWDTTSRALTTTRGGYLDAVRGFDAAFFSLSQREAPWVDPQHRLLLEAAYHALEDAGIAPDRLAGTSVGAFVGISSNEYAKLVAEHAGCEMYLATGNAASMAAHRLSYHLDLHGPSLALDTACSSSLTAVHYACQALRNGECDLALAAGVNLILTPDVTEALSRAQMLSPQARCKTFDAAADGYVRGEGVGVVVLKPLALAQRDGDPIYAVIEASAINQDGRSNGITAPNGAAQAALLRQVLARAGRGGEDVGFVETHGTGTALGDPIEFDALREALGQGETPCLLGAVKANIGHLEAAAGIAGLIKAALQLHHGEIAPLVGLEQVNPLIRLDGSRFHLPRTRIEWPRRDKPRLAGVSSFGFGGTNVHVLLSEAPPSALPIVFRSSPHHLVPLAARTEPALRDAAANLVAWLRSHDAPLADVAHTLALGRTHHPHRLVVLARDPADLSSALEAWLRAGRHPRVQTGKAFADLSGRVAFLFTGQGAASAGMAQALREYEVFRATLDRCDEVVRGLSGWSVREVLDDASRLQQTEFAQPALFAFQVALAALWRSWGVEPAAVLGHSVGECAAACVAGMLSLEDALKLVDARGRQMQACPAGAMLACLAPVEQVLPTLERYRDRIALAADNGPGQCVLSGDPGAIAAAAMELAEARIDTRPLKVNRAFHSSRIEPALAGIRAAAAALQHQPPRIAIVSNVTGQVIHDLPTADYWAEHARSPVQFAAGLRTLRQLGITHHVEIGPAAVLSRLGPTCVPGSEAVWLASAGANGTDEDLLRALGRLYVEGARLDWSRLEGAGRRVRLPGYPFQHRDYWFDDLPRAARAVAVPVAVPAAWRPRSCWAQHLTRVAPTFGSLTEAVSGCVDAAWAKQPLAAAVELRPRFDRLAGVYVVAALARLGWRPQPGETTTLAALADRLGVAAHKARLLRRCVQLAAEDGWLSLDGECLTVVAFPPADDVQRGHAELLERYPEFEVELRLAHHCAAHLAGVLRGEVDPLQVLFDGPAARWTAEIYSRAPVARFYNALLTGAVAKLVATLPEGRPLRIVELGAGTGGTTQALLAVLPRGRTEYVFSDVSSLFLARARAEFAGQALHYHMLDLERPPSEQGFAPGQFDVAVAANVLHATADLRRSLRHARTLLTPGGLLVLLEGTGPRRLLDLIFGLTEGWWRFVDDGLRPDYPLLAPAAWRRLLLAEGFDAVVTVPEGDARLPDPDQVVILARCGSAPPQHPSTIAAGDSWLLAGAGPLADALAECLTASGVHVVRSLSAGGEGLSGSTPTRAVLLPGATRPAMPASLPDLSRVTVGEWPAPEPGVRLIDLDPAHPVSVQAAILAEALLRPDGEPVVAYRGDQRYVPPTAEAVPFTEGLAGPQGEAPDRAALLAASPFERRALVEGHLRQELSRLLGSPISDEELEMPVQSLGLDSLMAIQVRNRVEASLGVSLSLVDFLKGLRLRELVDGIVAQLDAVAGPRGRADEGPASERPDYEGPASERPDYEGPPVPRGEVGSLSERELDSLLVSLLDAPREGR